ncbi:SNF2 family N-terminal domain-containing protein [Aspergillus karnatakaensis]|uniref:SNF2 family N-terminal domain-containing protein n=1 Tax=Aspergillus karnatakaensis TaxID=1810916 RepID=UPI003CCD991E
MVTPPAKRPIRQVDITLDEVHEVAPAPPPKYPRLSGQRFGQETTFVPLNQASQVSLIEDEDDAAAADLFQGSQDTDDSSDTTQLHYGDLKTKIVGVRYYRGQATIGEHVVLKREPQNKYDRNAIRVDNVMGAQVGHIPKNMAAKLASYLDNRILTVEGILTGVIGAYDCPIVLKLYGPSGIEAREALRRKMEQDKLPLNHLKQAERDEKKRQKEREKAAKEAAKRARTGQLLEAINTMGFSNLSRPLGEEIIGEESLDELINQSSTFNPREIGQVAESFGLKESDLENMPMADSPPSLSTTLLPYQRQGLAWMISKENPELPTGANDVVQLWKKQDRNYTNIATNFSTATPPPLASGGILADDMGLGKTIQIISLILSNSQPKTEDSSKATLIIAPVGVMSNWKNQIQDHTHPEQTPRVLIYHGSGKKEARNLAQYNVVITSYGALAMEYKSSTIAPAFEGLFSLRWRRVVLDEGHTIRNPRSKGSLAACDLRADSRWTLTGTPIINTLRDLYSQIRFLGLSGGLEDLAVFNSVLIRPLMADDPDSRLLLQALMSTICLRRRKDMSFVNLRLPPITSRVLRVKFHPHEQQKYDMFQSEAKGVLNDLKSKDKTNTTYSHLLEVILRLRQVCNHWALCKNRLDKLAAILDKQQVVPLTPENIKALQDLLQIRIESQETCPICLDNLDDPVITACAHAFCRACIEQVIDRQNKCPMCRAEIKDNTTLVAPAAEMGEDTDDIKADPDNPSSKIEALVKILTAQGQAEGTKTVVFSQWTSFLNLVEPHLEKAGIQFARIDGKMTSSARDASTTRFSTEPNCKVLLASLSVCSVGLNLVAANQAILADSWWAPAIEDQAVDRVYRLGQKRETTVWRLVMEDSIEDRVLAVQEQKRKLMLAAFREKSSRKVDDRATRVAELETLLS